MTIPWPKLRVALLKLFSRWYLEIVLGSVVVVLAAGYVWFIRGDLNQTLTRGRYNLLSSRAHAKYLEKYVEDLQRLEQQLQTVGRQQLEKLAAMLPPEPDLPGLLVQLEAIARNHGLVVHSMQFAVAAPGPASPPELPPDAADENESAAAIPQAAAVVAEAIQAVDISLTLSGGNYAALKRYLGDMESNLRLFDVQSINFGSADRGPYSINLKAYYRLR